MYEFKVDLNGDAVEDLTYRFTFDPRDASGKQGYVVRRIWARMPSTRTRPVTSLHAERPTRP